MRLYIAVVVLTGVKLFHQSIHRINGHNEFIFFGGLQAVVTGLLEMDLLGGVVTEALCPSTGCVYTAHEHQMVQIRSIYHTHIVDYSAYRSINRSIGLLTCYRNAC